MLVYALALEHRGSKKESRQALENAAALAEDLKADDPRGIVRRIAEARGG
jgi:hypothetical protein